ncbi:MAG TPA: response regulator, partial [Chthoniobacterales bacterium]|nr:response regulator [Chthoniobacterales bacterium]
KARVYFENGQVRHATAPGRQGMEAFNEIIRWKGGMVAEAIDAPATPQTISMDWQQLLMEAVRNADEMGAGGPVKKSRKKKGNPKILVVDDSLMLLSFVKEVLIDANYDVFSASSGDEAVREAQSTLPDLMLLDFILPDMRGDEVCRRLLENPGTAGIPVVYMSGYGAELQASRSENSNVIGFLNKPFTSDLLIKTVETHMPRKSEGPESTTPKPAEPQPEPSPLAAFPVEQEPAYREISEVGPELPQSESPQPAEIPWWTAAPSSDAPATAMPSAFEPAAEQSYAPDESLTAGLYFCGDTRFFGINRALQIIAHNKLTGTLRFFWEKQPVDLLTREGAVLFATTNDPDLYCSETPVALSSVDAERVAAARARQQETGCPLFLILSQDDLISHDAAFQLAQQHGQKVFAELWAAQCVRFSFHNNSLADFAGAVSEQTDVDQFALATLRMVQFPQLGERAYYDPASVPAYTRDGFERIQQLRLTVAEAQFASQFNGMRSVQQIAKNLRLDLKLASVTLFRFLALEVVECWPANAGSTQESKGLFKKLGSAIGLGE